MTLSREVYQSFENIVGADYISDDPALLDCYRYPLSHTAIHIGPYYRVYTPRGEAVLLPGSAEEVQAIVKLCNKHKIRLGLQHLLVGLGISSGRQHNSAGHEADGQNPGN